MNITFSRTTKYFCVWLNVFAALCNFGVYAYDGNLLCLGIAMGSSCVVGWCLTWKEE